MTQRGSRLPARLLLFAIALAACPVQAETIDFNDIQLPSNNPSFPFQPSFAADGTTVTGVLLQRPHRERLSLAAIHLVTPRWMEPSPPARPRACS